MKNILKYSITTISIIGLLSGCGDSSSQPAETKINQNDSLDTNVTDISTTVYVERGPVYESIVKDANGNIGKNKINTNQYTFNTKPTYPIVASSGYMYINSNTKRKAYLDINLSSYTNNITPITTLLSESNETKKELMEDELISLFNLDRKELYLLPSQNKKIDKLEELSNAIYIKSKEENSSIQKLFNYNYLVVDKNITLKNKVNSYSDLNYTGTLESHLTDINSSLFSMIPYKEVNTIDDIESIWNVSVPINIGVNYSSFNIGVRFVKSENDGSDDMGDFVYKNVSIKDNNISAPSTLDIYGYGDSQSGGTFFNDSYDPSNVRDKSLSLNNGILKLNLGYVMKSQTVVSESKFKVSTDYRLQIVATKPIFKDSQTMNLKLISNNYDFTNSQGVRSDIKIK